MTVFKKAKLAGLSINLKTNEIVLSVKVPLSEDSTIEDAQGLEDYLDKDKDDAKYVELTIAPWQPKLPHMP